MDVLAQGPRLLEHAVSYVLPIIRPLTPELLPRATPCAGWDLRMLVSHLASSLGTLSQGLAAGSLDAPLLPASGTGADAGPAGGLAYQARRLLAACAATPADRVIAIDGHGLTACILAATGAIETAVHGWDISAACGSPEPIPPALATSLLAASALLIPPGTRRGLFADPVPPPVPAAPSQDLLAFLGRTPDRTRAPAGRQG